MRDGYYMTQWTEKNIDVENLNSNLHNEKVLSLCWSSRKDHFQNYYEGR